MLRLIVDDGGQQRAFSVGEGRLSVGSGAEAQLKLLASGVASVHVDIEVHAGKAILHPRPGVSAPQILGRAVSGPIVLQHGVPIQIGGAQLTAEYEGVLLPSSTTSATRAREIPTWAWIAAGIPLVGLCIWFASSRLLGRHPPSIHQVGAQADFALALDRFEHAQYEEARLRLEQISTAQVLEPELALKVEQLRAEVSKKLALSDETMRNEVAGKAYFTAQLEGFVKSYLSAEISSPKVRVFMKRARSFREKWPTHPELGWVTRQEERFKAAIDLSQPVTFEDIQFEIESLTWDHPRDYKQAFDVARAFRSSARADELSKIAALLEELEAKRADWFKERLEQARWNFERKEQGESIGILLSIIRGSGDEVMADDAAARLLKYGDMQTWLRDFRAKDPDGFAEFSKNRVIRAFMDEHKL